MQKDKNRLRQLPSQLIATGFLLALTLFSGLHEANARSAGGVASKARLCFVKTTPSRILVYHDKNTVNGSPYFPDEDENAVRLDTLGRGIWIPCPPEDNKIGTTKKRYSRIGRNSSGTSGAKGYVFVIPKKANLIEIDTDPLPQEFAPDELMSTQAQTFAYLNLKQTSLFQEPGYTWLDCKNSPASQSAAPSPGAQRLKNLCHSKKIVMNSQGLAYRIKDVRMLVTADPYTHTNGTRLFYLVDIYSSVPDGSFYSLYKFPSSGDTSETLRLWVMGEHLVPFNPTTMTGDSPLRWEKPLIREFKATSPRPSYKRKRSPKPDSDLSLSSDFFEKISAADLPNYLFDLIAPPKVCPMSAPGKKKGKSHDKTKRKNYATNKSYEKLNLKTPIREYIIDYWKGKDTLTVSKPGGRQSSKYSLSDIDKQKLIAIDTLARTCYGEIGSCQKRESNMLPYVMAMLRIYMNRVELTHRRYNDPHYKVASPFFDVATLDLIPGVNSGKMTPLEAFVPGIGEYPWHFSTWNYNDPNAKKILCLDEPNADRARKRCLQGATSAVTNPEWFKEVTAELKGIYFYTSEVDPTNDLKEIENSEEIRVFGHRLDNKSCLRFFWDPNIQHFYDKEAPTVITPTQTPVQTPNG